MRKWLLSGIAGVLGALLIFAPVEAASAPASSNASGQGLEISPPVIELSANPGQTITTMIRVRNVTSGELVATGRADDFGAGSDESGTPKLLLNETGETRYSLKYWIAGVPNLVLAPQELKTTIVTINVPANAEPGGHYGVVRFTGIPPNLAGTGVALSASVGALILLRVNGNITDKLSMAEFSVGKNNLSEDVFTNHDFFESGPVDFLVRTRNDGTVHEQPKGTITVKNMFGGKIATLAVNPLGGNVLPDSIRRFTETLPNKKLFGRYTAKLALTYDVNKTLSASLSFWVIPWKLVLLVILGLVIILYLLKIALHKYNEHIISQARRR